MGVICRDLACDNHPMKRIFNLTFVLVIGTALSIISSTCVQASGINIGPEQLRLPVVNSGEVSKYQKIVALADGSAEIIAALGYKSNLVGRDIASTMPELASVPIDTNAHQVAVERVLSQHPDLIFIDANTSPTSALDVLTKSGIKIVKIPSAFSLASVVLKERAIASALVVPKAEKLLEVKMTSSVFPKSKTKVAFLYLRGNASIYLVGGKGSGADSILSKIGFTDVGANLLKTPFTALSAEALIKLQPDVLLLMTKGLQSVGGVSGLVALPGIAQTPAGKNKRYVTVDDSLLLSFGPRTISMLPLLQQAIAKVAGS
jgi:iron complex transport system substrate-binding protein